MCWWAEMRVMPPCRVVFQIIYKLSEDLVSRMLVEIGNFESDGQRESR